MAAKTRQAQSQRPAPKGKHSSFPYRKSLKQSLKDMLLRTSRKSTVNSDTMGSGILRRAGPTQPYWPSTTTLFSFPDQSSVQFSLDNHTTSNSIPNRFHSPSLQTPVRLATHKSLLPATSLSQFNLHQVYLHPSTVPQRPIRDAILSRTMSVASRHASIATFATLSTISSASTLRISKFHDSPPTSAWSSPSALPEPRVREAQDNHVSWLQSATTSPSSLRGNPSILKKPQEYAEGAGIRSVEHFRSFCILDTARPGCPVVATSRELCYIFDIGEQFVLNNSECEGASMDIVTGQDAAGDPVTHLVLFTPLVIPSSGRSRFMLACLVDVTKFINDTASLPDLHSDLDTSTIEVELHTPLQDHEVRNWHGTSYKLSADDLLGGCILPDDRDIAIKSSSKYVTSDDIWLNLANEERDRKSSPRKIPRSAPKTSQPPRSDNTSLASSTGSTVDEALNDFISGLQELYSEFFLLAKSPLTDSSFEICNVSPVLFELRDYVNGHLSRTGKHQMAELSAALAQGSPFNMPVRWGDQGVNKHLYCSPMYTATSVTWICFLVDERMPMLW